MADKTPDPKTTAKADEKAAKSDHDAAVASATKAAEAQQTTPLQDIAQSAGVARQIANANAVTAATGTPPSAPVVKGSASGEYIALQTMIRDGVVVPIGEAVRFAEDEAEHVAELVAAKVIALKKDAERLLAEADLARAKSLAG